MGNRHHNKKLRAAVRATMARTGESYQTVLSRLRSQELEPVARAEETIARASDVDLIPVEYFGIPLTIATFRIVDDLSYVVTPGSLASAPFPRTPLFGWARPRSLS